MLYLALISGVMASCNTNPDQKVTYYFDTDSLMHIQRKMLYEQQASIKKRAVIKGEVEEAQVHPDSLKAWEHEFQILEMININKPVLKEAYSISEYADSQSNLTVREYKAVEDDLEVPYLKIYYLRQPEALRKLEAAYVERNPIYKSERKLSFTFEDFTGASLLHRYSIDGTQKMLLMDSVNFEITGEIIL